MKSRRITFTNYIPKQDKSKERKSPRMRTIPESIRELQAVDPETSLTLSALRRLVKQGKVPCVQVDNKRLINLDQLFEYLSTPQYLKPPQAKIGEITPIRE